MINCLASRIAPLSMALGMTFAIGCSAPAIVQGTVAAENYEIQDNTPALRLIGGQMHIVLDEEDGELLRVVTLEVPDLDVLPLGEAVELGADTRDDIPSVTVSQGDLVETERSDGVRIISSERNTFYEVSSGSLTIHDRDETINGEFVIDLVDGGQLVGSFSLQRD